MICQTQSKTENRVKRVAVYSDYLALQCGLIGYTIDTINGRHEKSCLPFLRQCAASSSDCGCEPLQVPPLK